MTHRFLIAVAFFLSFTTATKAQFSVGVSAGGNLTCWKWFYNELNLDLGYDPGPGFRAAIFTEYQLSPGLAIRAELANQVFGNRLKVEATDSNGGPTGEVSTLRASYNSVGGSLLLTFLPLKKLPNLYVLAGPAFAYVTHGWLRFPAGYFEGRDKPWRERISPDDTLVRRDQWLAELGLGYAHAFGAKNRVAVEFRYQHGLTGIASSTVIDSGIQTVLLSVAFQRNL
ncbi:MAG: PorT family protein [Lewinellaceae bacterium]|nr:PorT family protein [Saprospiraceae bacterium]MCB9331887.1 PorT family protein [Lewinellaceae bacterium]